jgi:hypothetical protein
MSPEGQEPGQVQEEERLPLRAVGTVAAVAMIVFALAILWSTRILDRQTREARPQGAPPAPAAVGQPEIGIVDQTQFELEGRAEALRREQLEALEGYGWVDRDAGVIHIPIQEAMRQLTEELRR